MKHLLSEARLDRILEPFARDSALLAFDFDGTLAPLTAEPAQARMRTETRRLIQQVAQVAPCAVLSSRPQAELTEVLAGAAVWEVIGNHGLEPDASRVALEARVRSWTPILGERLAAHAGVTFENKGLSLAIHYRHATEPGAVRKVIEEVLSDTGLGPLEIIRGHDVVNVLPRGAPRKGQVLSRLVEQRRSDPVLFVGDDESDEDVFATNLPGLLSVRVGSKEGSRAEYFLEDQREIDSLLARLVSVRTMKPRDVPTLEGRLGAIRAGQLRRGFPRV